MGRRVRLTSMSAMKKVNDLLEDKLRHRVMKNADLSHIMLHTAKCTVSAGVVSQSVVKPATIATI